MRQLARLMMLAAASPMPLAGQQQATTSPVVETGGRPPYFAVSVQDVDRSVAWYRSVFGLKQLDDERAADGTWRIVNLAADALHVEVIWDRRDQTVQGPRGFAKVGFGVRSVQDVADRIETAIGQRPRIVDVPKHRLRIVQLVDPDGNIIQLMSPAPGPGERE